MKVKSSQAEKKHNIKNKTQEIVIRDLTPKEWDQKLEVLSKFQARETTVTVHS